MNLKHHYWYFTSVLSHKFCDQIIEQGKKNKDEFARIGFLKDKNLSKDQIKEIKKKRDSNVTWMNDPWIYREILPYVHAANKNAGWNFNFDFSESCQFTKYSQGQYYGWHCDSWIEPYKDENINLNNKIRKLSVTCSLSDYSEYTGGELEFNFNDPEKKKKQNIKKCVEILPKGSICVFPSFVWHRVCPVKKGTRYSLVIWNIGESFK
jgi:PKHD-type hydroxylase